MNKNIKKRKIEPHVILHLRINQEDIDVYTTNKIQIDNPRVLNNIVEPKPYQADNIDIFTNSFKNEPKPASLDYMSFETFDNFQNENYKLKENSLHVETNKNTKNNTNEKEKNDNTLLKHNLNVSHINLDKNTDLPNIKVTEDSDCSDTKIKLITSMREFADANRRNEWPRNTDIWCGWCSHSFTGPPVSIPKWYIKKTFFVSGCYCSYSCASKHLFSRNDINESNKWKYYNLLHLLRKRILNIDDTTRIPLAPSKETLKVFGGHLSIDEYRNITSETHNCHKIYNILEPPMISIIPSIEETTYPKSNLSNMRLNNTKDGMSSYSDVNYITSKNENYYSTKRWGNDNSYIPVDDDRLKRAAENLKIKRKAPLIDKKKTLLHYMNLKINKKS